MKESVTSVGIDIGTSTTQLIFSKLTIENRAAGYMVPKVEIVDKEVIYCSDIYFTPLISNTEIDGEKVSAIIRSEYEKANIRPEEVSTGAVIITGETARKQNANIVLNSLSDLAGDFVVATAGPDLESVLSGRGAGTDVFSEEHRNVVANLDVGGGTTNIAVFRKGSLQGVTCLDIGGRLIKIENGKISYIYRKIQELAQANGIQIREGDEANVQVLEAVCRLMAQELKASLHLDAESSYHRKLYTNQGKGLPEDIKVNALTFSGGVANYIYEPTDKEVFKYGDIGILLGTAIAQSGMLDSVECYRSEETIRATVVGAGTHTTEISGSTIFYQRDQLPIKNVPVLKLSKLDEETPQSVSAAIKAQLPIYQHEGKKEPVAIALSAAPYDGFDKIQELAAAIIEGAEASIKEKFPLIVVLEADVGKALGNALHIKLNKQKDVICIDGVRSKSGDYIDIGEPVGGGYVLPVVVKTLIFNS
ncbi:ethanolamine ammonia-lyase reactivating factor EutA [Aminipila luticellarii]|uniref:Ethanolamine ammonia-lyase reactivating factor EutA n=1 Tax=Aminipila luticellarii TaxID=2507160 RepID=A0A410PXU9_9FIRM|nr:ethanolamine ammonia-lyase reactivating factor EutA [Aminipila luticellarii]QAT43781.1 ethanolamine ammonia-lyase reactivating factor EutA [Aminipila luticellarii]